MMLTYLFEAPYWPESNHDGVNHRDSSARQKSPSRPASLKNLHVGKTAVSTQPETPTHPVKLNATDPYLQRTLHELSSFAPESVPLEDRFFEQHSKSGKFKLTSFAWNLKHQGKKFAECRCVRILGRGTDILNSWVFPIHVQTLPVFAAEILEFGHQPRLVFIDLQAPGWSYPQKRQLTGELSELRDTSLLLPNCAEAPEWATQDGLGLHLHSRPGDPNFRPMIQDLYSLYLKSWTDAALRRLPVEAGASLGQQALTDYQKHHQESSPGNAYLSQLFGVQWTRDFYEQFLYAPVISAQRGTTL
jgi:hypothetical protein